MEKELILKVQNLSVILDQELIIKNLSFEVKRGEVLVILGPNGAGKTVLLKTLLGIFPYRGKIVWKEGIKIGYVPQRLPFIKKIPLKTKELFRSIGVKEETTKSLLLQVGIEKEVFDKNLGEISSGQFQRILIAWALSDNPDVLLFDEPMVGVDIEGQESIYSLLERINKEKGLTILLITHDLNIVYRFATNVLCLNKTRLCFGPPQDLTQEKLSQLFGAKIGFYSHHKND